MSLELAQQEKLAEEAPAPLDITTVRTPRNRLIMLRYAERQSIPEIAAAFGLSPVTVSNILRSPLVQQELAKITDRLTDRVVRLGDEALDLCVDTMRGANMSEMKWKAAKDLLDRNAELAPKSQSGEAMMAGLGEGLIRELGRQLRQGTVPALDAEVIEEKEIEE